jgi:hypothetical protein
MDEFIDVSMHEGTWNVDPHTLASFLHVDG